MIARPTRIAAAALSALLLLSPFRAAGDTDVMVADSTQQDEARDAVRQGLVRPLEEILTEVRKIIVGDIVEIEFEKDDGRYIYEIEYVAPDGHLMDIKIDAKTLAVLSHDQEDED